MDPKIIVRAITVILLAGSVLACAVEVARLGRSAEPSVPTTQDSDDPLATEIARCKALGAEAANDVACKAAWSRSRERFLAPGIPYQSRTIDPFPATPNTPAPKATPKIFLDRAPSTSQSNSGSPPDIDSEGR